MEHKLKRTQTIRSPQQVEDLIKLVNKFALKVIKIGRGTQYRTLGQYLCEHESSSLTSHLIVELKETKLEITTKYYDGKPCTYIFSLNNVETFSRTGHSCFAQFQRAFKVPNAKKQYDNPKLERWFDTEKNSYVCSASPIIGFNPNFENMIIQDCWEYDLNSAYSAVLIHKMPDLYHPRWELDHKVKPGFVGFYLNDQLTMVPAGGYADVTFPLIDTPEGLKEYVDKWYNKKRLASGAEKEEAKAMLNLPIGYTQRFNPFLRSYIVHSCNEQIIELIDRDSLFWNTDAIFSKRRRTDLEIGDKIGQFKEIHYKVVRYTGNIYQLDDQIPVYRGVPKAWFRRFEQVMGRPFDILLDDVPPASNLYEWDWDKLSLRRNYD